MRFALAALLLLMPAYAVAPIGGMWTWAGAQGSDFQITVKEDGRKVWGDMTGTALKGARVSTGSFTGTRAGNVATLEWHFKDGDDVGPVAGSASLERVNRTLHWTLNYNGSQDCWFPRAATLRRK